uniref:hypothetical protein n=1 Tax=Agathobacter sp. TaxID=2021311 RepID=UPI00402A0158
MKENLNLSDKKMVMTIAAFAVIVAVMVLIGVCVLHVPVVAMCLLVILETALAVFLHHAELWLHGVVILAEVIAGILCSKILLVVLCAVVYVAATACLQVSDRGEK